MNVKTHEGKPEGKGRRVAVVVSRFNDLVGQRLLKGALETLSFKGVAEKDVEVAWVPGAWELPAAAAKFAKDGKFDGVVALGCIIRGETTHHEHIASEVAAGLGRIVSGTGIPVAFGVLTTDDLEQALARAGERENNKGAEAVLHLLETIAVIKKIGN
jgi:6,7-dimethyl-8-ribityllumazine synthase